MGGLDWAGLPLVAEMLGIDNPQQLINRLLVIRSYNPKDRNGPGDAID
jgi:hypothetical protein